MAAEGAEEVQGAANGFGELIACTIRVAPEREGDPALLVIYAANPTPPGGRSWTVEPRMPEREEAHVPHDNG